MSYVLTVTTQNKEDLFSIMDDIKSMIADGYECGKAGTSSWNMFEEDDII